MRTDLAKRLFLGAVYALLGGSVTFAVAAAISTVALTAEASLWSSPGAFLVQGFQAMLGALLLTAFFGILMMGPVVLIVAVCVGYIVIKMNIQARLPLIMIGLAIGPVCWIIMGLLIGANLLDVFNDEFSIMMLSFLVPAGLGGVWLAKQAWFHAYSVDDLKG